jgi:hypothetical protein
MTSWDEFSSQAPELAAAVRRSFAGGKHKVMATLRSDGSPRVSGTEVDFADGHLWLGSMPGAVKARDLQRDPRIAIHGPTVDEKMELGDAKLSGRAEEITDPDEIATWAKGYAERVGQAPPQPFHLFRVLVDEVVRSRVEGDRMVIESWHADGRGVVRVERA